MSKKRPQGTPVTPASQPSKSIESDFGSNQLPATAPSDALASPSASDARFRMTDDQFREWVESRVADKLKARLRTWCLFSLAIVMAILVPLVVLATKAFVNEQINGSIVDRVTREEAPKAIEEVLIGKKELEKHLRGGLLEEKVPQIVAAEIGKEPSAIRGPLAMAVIQQMAEKRSLVEFSKTEFIRRYQESRNPAIRKSAIQQMGLIAPDDAKVREILLANAADHEVDVSTRAIALRLYHPNDKDARQSLTTLLSSLPTDQELRAFKDLHAAYVECLSRFPAITISDMQKWLESSPGQITSEFPRRPRVVAYALARMDSDAGLDALSSLIERKDQQIAEFGFAGLTQLDPNRLLVEDDRLQLLVRCKTHLLKLPKNRTKVDLLFGPVTRSEPSATTTGPESLDVGFRYFIVAQNGEEKEVLLKWPLKHGEITATIADDDTAPFFALLRNDDGEGFYQRLPDNMGSAESVIVATTLLHAWIGRLQRFDKSDDDSIAHSDELMQKMLKYDECHYFPVTAYAISYAMRHASPMQTNAFLRSFIEKYSYGKGRGGFPELSFVNDQGVEITESFATNLISIETLQTAVTKDEKAEFPYSGVEELVNDFLKMTKDSTALSPDLTRTMKQGLKVLLDSAHPSVRPFKEWLDANPNPDEVSQDEIR